MRYSLYEEGNWKKKYHKSYVFSLKFVDYLDTKYGFQ